MPALIPGDYLLCDALSPRLGRIRRGDIVVLQLPTMHGVHTIKRVIALPGDTVTVTSGRGVLVSTPGGRHEGAVKDCDCGNEVTESLVGADNQITVGTGKLYVLGDNLDFSTDSREFGPVSIDDVVAVVRCRYRRGPTSNSGQRCPGGTRVLS